MNVIAFTIPGVGDLLAARVGAIAVGSSRSRASTATQMALLKASRNPATSDRYDARELEGLRTPMQRYFRAVSRDGQPFIVAATVNLVGTINMSTTGGDDWKPVTSTQVILAWDCSRFSYQLRHGMQVPTRGKVAKGGQPYCVGDVTSVAYEFAS
jgi:hypothetical protein